ncbi:hypothetical protein C0991_003657, partial [Blastosporella zonata]
MLYTGFYGLLRLGDMAWLDDRYLWDDQRLPKLDSVNVGDNEFSFLLPTHKADPFFEGQKIVVKGQSHVADPF